jgi:fructose-bisphosphate aldolase, class I
LNEYISGVICYEETLFHKCADGRSFVDVLTSQGIIPGIKVDKGVVPIAGTDKETVTQGIDDLGKRCERYYRAGARFAKWRGVINISSSAPSELGISLNVEALARYASICQARTPACRLFCWWRLPVNVARVLARPTVWSRSWSRRC